MPPVGADGRGLTVRCTGRRSTRAVDETSIDQVIAARRRSCRRRPNRQGGRDPHRRRRCTASCCRSICPAPVAKDRLVRNGDSLRVSRLRPRWMPVWWCRAISTRPVPIAYHDGMRLTDVLRSVDDLKPNADLHYVLIRRESPPDRRISVLSADLVAALQDPDSNANVAADGRVTASRCLTCSRAATG